MDENAAHAVIDKIIKDVGSCGLYYEIYLYRLTKAVRDYFIDLPPGDQSTFIFIAEAHYDIHFDNESFEAIKKAEAACWEEIRKDQV